MAKPSSTRRLWKKTETRICRALGGDRTPLSGSNSKQTSADCIQTKEYVEIKHRAKIPFFKDFQKAEENAKKEGKPLLFVIHEKGKKSSIVFMNLEQYLKIV